MHGGCTVVTEYEVLGQREVRDSLAFLGVPLLVQSWKQWYPLPLGLELLWTVPLSQDQAGSENCC